MICNSVAMQGILTRRKTLQSNSKNGKCLYRCVTRKYSHSIPTLRRVKRETAVIQFYQPTGTTGGSLESFILRHSEFSHRPLGMEQTGSMGDCDIRGLFLISPVKKNGNRRWYLWVYG